MDVKILQETPPWDWPKDARKIFKRTLLDRRADPADRVIAAGLAGNMVAINDELADALLATVGSPAEPEKLRATSAIALGPVLEQAYIDEFEDPDDVPITEDTFLKIQDSLHKHYLDDGIPKEVRRNILEASVRAPEDWHNAAIAAAYSSGDREWMLTAVFAMGYVRGFDEQILESLKSADKEIHFQAVEAAGTWQIDGAWPHVVALVKDTRTPTPLMCAAIEAIATIRPAEAKGILEPLTDSDDEDVVEAALDALGMAEGMADEDEDEEEDEGEDGNDGGKWVN